MFEITLGNWVPVCRALTESVSEWYGLLFIVYKLLVGFAVLKCISAIFLCETMKCASTNDQRMIQQRMRAKQHFVDKMTMLFEHADDTGDGTISQEEFVKIMESERVKLWLQAMEFNIPEPVAFFRMIDTEGDGELDAKELITGMSRMRGPATQISMKMSHDSLLQQFGFLGKAIHDWEDKQATAPALQSTRTMAQVVL